jgi:signal transduction histidine kinase
MEERERRSDWDSAVQEMVVRVFFRNLAIYLLLDGVVYLCFQGPSWGFVLLFTLEAVALVVSMQRNTRLLRRIQRPLEALGETAGVLAKADLTAENLQELAARLDAINVKSLDGRLQLPEEGSLSALTRAINGMLERLDQGYQAQARFVSDASHELRTPIAVVQGYANLLSRWGKDDPVVRQEAIDAIQKETDYMSRLVQQLLFLARGDNETQVVKLEPFCLSELAEETFRDMELLDTGRTLESDIAPDVFVNADRGLIRQAIHILMDNACKYTPEGGTVSLRLRGEGEQAVLSVADTGPGIPAEEQEKIFQRFYRADTSRSRQTGGTGLGLAIGRWIAQRHGGTLTVSSVEGLGSRFTLCVPRLEPSAVFRAE